MELPYIGLGTWDLRGNECTKIVQLALELGYRHIDTAHIYQNHQAIKKAIKDFDRRKLYITSKIAVDEQVKVAKPEESVQKACEHALKELGTDYLDLYLIHWPDRNFPLEKIFLSMEKLVEQGKIGKAGVSNYNIHHLEDFRKANCLPFANQVEFHPYLNQKELLDYCHVHHIKLIAFRPLGKGKLLHEEPLFDLIGEKYNKTGVQVILRWLIQKEISVIPKASLKKHL
ncbi:MAG: aldo/keto reductase [Ignavibacteriae bacterium]|nr:aldo/keto reductase [Ignavibacteriota bacterium]